MSGINAFFRDILGASFTNPRWSWGGVDHDNRRVFLRLWRDELPLGGSHSSIRILRKDHGQGSLGWNERLQHIDLLKAGYQGYAVLCNRARPGAGAIKSFDRDSILVLGPLAETDQDFTVEISGTRPVSEVARSPDTSALARVMRKPKSNAQTSSEAVSRYIARLAYNSQRWWRPTQASEVSEAGDSYRTEFGFGHEDWLFRNEWLLDGWRYGFVQGVNKSRAKLLREGRPFHLRLFTMPAPGDRRAVAEIREVECLSDGLAAEAVAAFERQGWLDVMRSEVAAAGGRVEALGRNEYAPFILNLRYRIDNVSWLDANTPLPPDDPIHNIKRYSLCEVDGAMDSAASAWRGRAGTSGLPEAGDRRRFVQGGWTTYSPEHVRMQNYLVQQLRERYPAAEIVCERDFVDVTVRTDEEILLFEVKSDLHPLSVVRQALGQVLEYAYHPRRAHDLPVKLVIAGRRPLEGDDLAYFEQLKQRFSLPLAYWPVPV